MKKILVVGLGNTLVPGDARAVDFIRTLAPSHEIEVIEAGADLLRVAERMKGRQLIVLADVVAHASAEIIVLEHGSPLLDDAQMHAHHLSAVQALDLIRFADEEIRATRCVWLLLGPRFAPVRQPVRAGAPGGFAGS